MGHCGVRSHVLHVQCSVFVTARFRVNIIFGDYWAAIAGKIPKPSEFNASNIQRPTFEQLSAERQNALDDIKKKIREEQEQEIQRLEQEAMKHCISHFFMDRQGKITKLKDAIFDSSQFE